MSTTMKKVLSIGVPLTTLIGIVACFGDDAVGASINPALAFIGEAFPDIPYSQILWLYSMPKLVIVPLTLIFGLITGRYITYRTAAIAGFTLIAIGGVMPVFMNDFWMILGARFVLGVGLAIQAPIGPALVLRYFTDPQKRATVLGIGHSFINVYGVITNVLVGSLCAIDWHYAFLAYSTIIILLILAILFVKEPPKEEGTEGMSASELMARQARLEAIESKGYSIEEAKRLDTPEVAASGKKGVWARMPKMAYAIVFAYLLTLTFWGVGGLNLSAVILQNGFGNAATAGVVISLINLSGVLSGLAFGLMAKFMKGYVLPFGMFLMAAGFMVYFFAPNIYVLAAGVFIAGFANTVIMTGFESLVGSYCDVSLISLGMSLCMFMSQLSGFICPFYISFVMDVLGFSSYTAPLAVSACLLTVMGIIFTFGTWNGRRRMKAAEA